MDYKPISIASFERFLKRKKYGYVIIEDVKFAEKAESALKS